MSHVPHSLTDAFPDDAEVLHRLKLSDTHFQGLSEDYHVVNREIHRIESGVEAAGDARLEELKKKRLQLTDEIAEIISGARV